MNMQTLTKLVLEHGLENRILSERQLARLVDGSDQRRYNLVNRALKAGELHRIRRGLYVLSRPDGTLNSHPYAVAQNLMPGSYVSLETALAYHGWIPESVQTIASIVPGRKSKHFDDERMGRFTFHPLAVRPGYFLELVERGEGEGQSFLVASPQRALLDLVCQRKLEWQGIDWFQNGLRIEREYLDAITSDDIQILKLVYKQQRMQGFLAAMEKVLA